MVLDPHPLQLGAVIAMGNVERRSARLAIVAAGSIEGQAAEVAALARQRPQPVEEVVEILRLIESRRLVSDDFAMRSRRRKQRRHRAMRSIPIKQERLRHDREVDRLRMQARLAPGGGERRGVLADDEAPADRDRVVSVDRLEQFDDEAAGDRIGRWPAEQGRPSRPSARSRQRPRLAAEVLPPQRGEIGLRGKGDRLRHERGHQEGLDGEASAQERSSRLRRLVGEDRLLERRELPLDAIAHEPPCDVVGRAGRLGVEGGRRPGSKQKQRQGDENQASRHGDSEVEGDKSPAAAPMPRPDRRERRDAGNRGVQLTSNPTTALAALAEEPASTVPASETLAVPKERRT